MKFSAKTLITVFICLTSIHFSQSLSCVDENGDSQDWTVQLRLHNLTKDERSYISFDISTQKWKNLAKGEDHLQKLLSQVDLKNDNYLAYNDEKPPHPHKENKFWIFKKFLQEYVD